MLGWSVDCIRYRDAPAWFVLSQIFWPHSLNTVRKDTGFIPNTDTSHFVVASEGTSFKATLWSSSDGVTCTEELVLGSKVIIPLHNSWLRPIN